MSVHIIDKVCGCKHCTMLDVMYGDPDLSKEGRNFVESLSEWGWRKQYTPKQKIAIERTFKRQSNRYANDIQEIKT